MLKIPTAKISTLSRKNAWCATTPGYLHQGGTRCSSSSTDGGLLSRFGWARSILTGGSPGRRRASTRTCRRQCTHPGGQTRTSSPAGGLGTVISGECWVALLNKVYRAAVMNRFCCTKCTFAFVEFVWFVSTTRRRWLNLNWLMSWTDYRLFMPKSSAVTGIIPT